MARRSSLASAVALALTIALAPSAAAPAAAAEGQITFAVTVSLAPTWFDPAETPGVITPFLALYALHDALVKPMPGNAWAPSLAESWTASKDGLTYEFVLRKGVRFHNEFYWAPPAYPYDPARAKQLLAEAGYPKGFDAVEVATDLVFAPEAETVINGLKAIGIRARLRPMVTMPPGYGGSARE